MTEKEDDADAELRRWLYNPAETQLCTNAFYRFISEYDKIIGLFCFIVNIATRTDEMSRIAAEALAHPDPPPPTTAPKVFERVQSFAPLLSRNLVTNMLNNFLCYVSEILQEVVKKHHEVLRSQERLTTEEVLQFSRVNDIIAFIADRKINELSYGGLIQMRQFISDRLGVEMFDDEKERMLLTIFVELRNIHTHNRGIVNELFLKRVGVATYEDFKFELGKAYHVNFDRFAALSCAAIGVALNLDEKLGKKFKLKRTHYKNRLLKERNHVFGAP